MEEEIEFEVSPEDLQEESKEEEEEELKKKKPYPYKEKLSAYTDFVKKYLKEHEGASVTDAAKAWKKKEGASEELDSNDYEAILSVVEQLRKKKKEYPEPEEEKKKPYPYEEEEKKKKYPYPEEEKKLSDVQQMVLDMKKQYESMSKKVEKIENTPVRISQNLDVQSNTDEQVQKFLSELTAGEVVAWAEKNKISWGKGE